MRGRTLNDSFIILDEAQNTTPEQMQMFLAARLRLQGRRHRRRHAGRPAARAGLGADPGAADPGAIDGIAFVEFTHEDVVRHKLVQRIVEAYKRHAEETGSGAAADT